MNEWKSKARMNPSPKIVLGKVITPVKTRQLEPNVNVDEVSIHVQFNVCRPEPYETTRERETRSLVSENSVLAHGTSEKTEGP